MDLNIPTDLESNFRPFTFKGYYYSNCSTVQFDFVKNINFNVSISHLYYTSTNASRLKTIELVSYKGNVEFHIDVSLNPDFEKLHEVLLQH